jgi:hypothetical protein
MLPKTADDRRELLQEIRFAQQASGADRVRLAYMLAESRMVERGYQQICGTNWTRRMPRLLHKR